MYEVTLNGSRVCIECMRVCTQKGPQKATMSCLSHTYSHSQLSDVVKVLCYLHFCNVIHGDPGGVRDHSQSRFTTTPISTQSNGVLVGGSGHARIAGFVLATGIKDVDSVKSDARQHSHTW